MKKIFTLIAAAVLGLSAYAEGLPVPYSAEISGYDNWDIKNLNEDAQEWQRTTGEYSFADCTKGLKYHWNSSMDANDWAISPAIHLEAGKEYKIKFAYKTGRYDEKLAVWFGTGNTPEQLQQGKQLLDFSGQEQNGVKKVELFTPAADGDYYIGAYAHSEKDKYNIYFTGVEIAENVFVPAAVTDLTVTPDPSRVLEAKLSWTLPTTDTDGAPFGDGVAVESVTVYRDGVKVADLPGTTTEWTDNAESGLTSGKHQYEVEVTVNGTKSAKVAVNSAYIGPVVAFNLPLVYSLNDVAADDFSAFFTVIRGEASNVRSTWQFSPSVYNGNSVQLLSATDKSEDDWLILPRVKVEKAGAYRFGMDVSNSQSKGHIEIKYGKSVDGLTPGIADLTGAVGSCQGQDLNGRAYRYYTFSFDEPGEYAIALHACSASAAYSTCYVYGFSVEEWHDAALNVTDLATEIVGNDIKVNWTNPSKTSCGNDITELVKVEVYRDGELAGTVTEGLVPGAACSYTDDVPAAGSYLYKVVAYNGEFAPDAAAPEVWSAWAGDKLQELPFNYVFRTAGQGTYALFTPEKINQEDPDWSIGTGGAVLALKHKSGYTPNSRLYTPPFNLAPGYYDVTLNIQGPYDKYDMQVGYVMEADAQNIKGNTTVQLGTPYSFRDVLFRIKVGEDGRGMFVAIANGIIAGDNYHDLIISGIKIERTRIIPAVATDVTVKAAEDKSLQATVSWTNPTTSNVEGETPELTKAVVYRNDVEIGTVTEGLVRGETSSFVDEDVPEAGTYTYKVEIYSADGCAAAIGVVSPWIGAGKDLPYESTQGDWTILNLNGDTAWGDPISWSEKSNGDLSIISYNNVADDWAITPRLNFQTGYLYTITCYPTKGLSSSSAVTEDMRVQLHFGTGITADEMTIKLADIGPFKATAEKELYTVQILAVDPSELVEPAAENDVPDTSNAIKVPAGVGTLGLHCAQKTDEIYIREFKVDGGVNTNPGPSVGISDIFGDGENLLGADARDITVYDLAGRAVMSADSFESLDAKRLAKGTYIVTGLVNGKRVSAKVAF